MYHSLVFIYFLLLFKYSLSPFSPHHSLLPYPSPPPTLNPTPLWLCPCVLHTCSLMIFPPFLPLSPPPSPLVTAIHCFLKHIFTLLIFKLTTFIPRTILLNWTSQRVTRIDSNVFLFRYTATERMIFKCIILLTISLELSYYAN